MSGLPPGLTLQQLIQLMQLMQNQQMPGGAQGGGPAGMGAPGQGAMLPSGMGNMQNFGVPGQGAMAPGGMTPMQGPQQMPMGATGGGPPMGAPTGPGAMLPGGGMGNPFAGQVPNMGPPPNAQRMPSMKKGGIVKKTGPHLLHKGEKVIPAPKAKASASKTPSHASSRHAPTARKPMPKPKGKR